MNNQKVCISKQTTFIAGIVLLLIMYVFIAYKTMINKTNTNSRASATNEVPLTVLPPPTDEEIGRAWSYQASVNGLGDVELKLPKDANYPQIKENALYGMYMQKADRSFLFIDSFKATNEIIKNKFNTYWTPRSPVLIKDIPTSTFFVYETK